MTTEKISARLRDDVLLSDWQLLLKVLGRVRAQTPDPLAPARVPQKPEKRISSQSGLAKWLGGNRRSTAKRFDRITRLFSDVGGGGPQKLITPEWTLSPLGKRVLLAAEIVLNQGLERAIDFLLSGHTEAAAGRLVLSAAEAVSTYLLPFMEPPPNLYRLLPWSPYMTSLAACDLLLERRADLIITWADTAELPRSVTKEVFQGERRVRVILHHSHPLAEKYAATADTQADGLPVEELKKATFAVPNDTHLAASSHELVNHLGGEVSTYNVGRFPQAINHVQLTGAFSLFPDWPWCLPALRRSHGIVAMTLDRPRFQPVRLQAMWRTQDGGHPALSDLRRRILATYDSLVGPPSWTLTAGVKSPPFDADSDGHVYFLSHPSDALISLGKWHEARVSWNPSDGPWRRGRWKPADDKRESCRVTLSGISDGTVAVEFDGEDGFRLWGRGVLAFSSRRRSDRSTGNEVLAGRVTLLTGGTLASGPLFVSPTALEMPDLRALRQLLDDYSFTS